MKNTKIEYLDSTWNPLAMRCTRVSPACDHCWHLRMCDRLAANTSLPKHIREAYAGDREPVLVSARLEEPLRMTKPRVIGVQFMGDLFHEKIDFFTIFKVYSIMRRAERHTFMVLTKRVKRALEFYDWLSDYSYESASKDWFPNLWVGATVEDQEWFNVRAPDLLKIPANLFVSAEPLLGDIDMSECLPMSEECATLWRDAGEFANLREREGRKITAVIAGGETGPGSRPLHPNDVRSLRDQCIEAGISFYFKQWGEWIPFVDGASNSEIYEFSSMKPGSKTGVLLRNHLVEASYSSGEKQVVECRYDYHSNLYYLRIGKKRSGRLLDGREWNELPFLFGRKV